MRSKALAVLTLGVVSVAGVASAQLCDETILPNAARTYCYTDPLLRRITGATSTPGAVPAYTDDNGYSTTSGDPGVTGGTEVVWRVIGALGQASFNNGSGEAYCGYVGIPRITISAATGSIADAIQDCVGAVRYSIASSSKAITSASLCWDGSNINGVWKNMAVTICDAGQSAPGTLGDTEPLAGPGPDGIPGTADDIVNNNDCIVDRLDFGGGSFAAIHNVEIRKADNTVGLVGGVADINFGEAFPTRTIALSDAAVRYLNDRQGRDVVFLVRCNEQHGNWNGAFGGSDNALVLHDPDGIGFPGFPGVLSLGVSRDKKDDK